jgi:transcriptional regulator with XRE-family HTH domain
MSGFSSRLDQAVTNLGYAGHGRQSEIRRRLLEQFNVSVTGQCVSNWFNGNTTPPSERMVQLATILGVEAGWLAHGAKDETPRVAIDTSLSREIRLTANLWAFIDGLVEADGFEDASDVLRAAVRHMRRSNDVALPPPAVA